MNSHKTSNALKTPKKKPPTKGKLALKNNHKKTTTGKLFQISAILVITMLSIIVGLLFLTYINSSEPLNFPPLPPGEPIAVTMAMCPPDQVIFYTGYLPNLLVVSDADDKPFAMLYYNTSQGVILKAFIRNPLTQKIEELTKEQFLSRFPNLCTLLPAGKPA